MKADRWSRVDQIFDAALELDGEARTSYLRAVCAGDAALRDEVESLLSADAAADGYLEPPQGGEEAGGSDDPTLLRDADLFPRYRLLRGLSHGTLASVYLASRLEPATGQLVVLKVLRSEAAEPSVRDRFAREQRILARLRHRHVARLYDAGTAAGPGGGSRPYLVLEYVEGVPIDDYCRRHDLSVEDRLRLLLGVCDAVAHAHQHLLVHRDIKPDNVLVTADGVPKLLDFGIAKPLAPERFGRAGDDRTRLGVRPMTLRYASPEQVRGEPVTLASDVYALGVVLYELLAGESPYRWRQGALYELEREICEEEPPPPSHRLVGRAAAAVAGDLDRVLKTALAKDPARRYPTVERFASDLRRHLEDRPVSVGPDTLRYRLGKLLRRHRATVAAGIAATLVVAAFITLLLVQNHRVRQQRAAAEAARDVAAEESRRAEEALAFMMDSFRLANPLQARGRQITAREILDAGTERASTALADQPAVQATMLDSLGRAYADLGDVPRAAELMEQAVRLREGRLDAASNQEIGSLNYLALLQGRLGRYRRSEALARQALEAWDRRGEVSADEDLELGVRTERMNTHLYLSVALLRQGRPADAEIEARRAVERAGDAPVSAQAHSWLGEVLGERGRFEEARAELRHAVETVERAMGPDHLILLQHRLRQARVGIRAGRPEEALDLLAEVIPAAEAALDENHSILVRCYWELGAAERAAGRPQRALAAWRRSLEKATTWMPPDHPQLAERRAALAGLLRELGRPEEAAEVGEGQAVGAETSGRRGGADLLVNLEVLAEGADRRWRTLDWRRGQRPPDPRRVAEAEVDLGRHLTRMRRYSEAEPLLLSGVETLGEVAPGDPAGAAGLDALVTLYRRWGRPQREALWVERRRVELQETAAAP